MPIQVKCACGKQFGVPEKYAGKKVKCPACSQPVVIPAAKPQAGAEVPSAGHARASTPVKITVKCACGKAISANVSLAGKTVKCPGCKEPLKIPLVKQESRRGSDSMPADLPATPSASTAVASSSPVEDLFDELGIAPIQGVGEGGATPARRCPECKAGMAEEAIVCIQCGYNERLGRKMETVRPRTQEDRKKKAAK